jgi:adenosylcobinamide-phosphate guanylyltransferase
MDALIMAGGRGKRMGLGVLKPLIPFMGKPLIQWVIDAAINCTSIKNVFVAITPETREIGEAVDGKKILTKGRGYVEDMAEAITRLNLKKTFVLSADLPLLTSSDLDWVIDEYEKIGTPALAVFAPPKAFREFGLESTLEVGDLTPTGVNIVDGEDINGEEFPLLTSRSSFFFNINTPGDLKKAQAFKSGKMNGHSSSHSPDTL